MKLKNEFANSKLASKTATETRCEALLQTVKDEILKIYIPYFDKLAIVKFTTCAKHRIVLDVIKKHNDEIEEANRSEMILRVYDMLNDILNNR